jgi:TolA-binding protein
MRKDERHQIKRDDLATVLETAVLYVQDNARRVGLVVVAVLALLAGGLGVSAWRASRDEQASTLLGDLIRTYRAPVATSLETLQNVPAGVKTFATPEEREARVVELADAILAEYGGTKAAPKALYYRGVALTSLKKHEEAAAALEEFLRKHPRDFVAPLARFELARVREAQSRHADALLLYQVLAEDARGLFPREEGLLGVGRCQEALGNAEEALKTYRRILSDYPDSEYQYDARQKVEELS